jgi:hypothetical protein
MGFLSNANVAKVEDVADPKIKRSSPLLAPVFIKG